MSAQVQTTEVWRIGDREFRSRLLIGTGKFPSVGAMKSALEASGTEIVTVALRRVDLTGQRDPQADMLEEIDQDKYLVLANTSGAMNAEEAVRLARLAVAAGLPKWIKLEIHPDPRYLLPDPIETLKATVMPLGAPIGSNRGIETRAMIEIIIEQSRIPVIVDAGLGAPSHAAEALEMGADAVLVNTAIAVAEDPVEMARAFRLGVEAGRRGFEAGLGPTRREASATSPLTGFLDE